MPRTGSIAWLWAPTISSKNRARHGRQTLIHPSQVGPCNEVFSPTEEEVE
jgi:hypothetical protein